MSKKLFLNTINSKINDLNDMINGNKNLKVNLNQKQLFLKKVNGSNFKVNELFSKKGRSVNKKNPVSNRKKSGVRQNYSNKNFFVTYDELNEIKDYNEIKSPLVNFNVLETQTNNITLNRNNNFKNKNKKTNIFGFFKLKNKDKNKFNFKNNTRNILNSKKKINLNIGISYNKLHTLTYYMKSMEYHYKISKVEYFTQIYREHFNFSFNSLKYINTIKNHEMQPEKKPTKIWKNRNSNIKYTLVFDLDETLIHCSEKEEGIKIKFKLNKTQYFKGNLFIRPFLNECLEDWSKNYELILFTASQKIYAEEILKHIDPEDKYFKYKFYRNDCFKTKKNIYIKDLRVIDRPINEIILVDNASYSFGFQLNNGIPIIPFYNSIEDTELLQLSSFLNMIKEMDDIQKFLQSYFKYFIYSEFDNLNELFKSLFIK